MTWTVFDVLAIALGLYWLLGTRGGLWATLKGNR